MEVLKSCVGFVALLQMGQVPYFGVDPGKAVYTFWVEVAILGTQNPKKVSKYSTPEPRGATLQAISLCVTAVCTPSLCDAARHRTQRL